MLVQTHYPEKLTAARYDRYLASGWFRGSSMLYKMDMLCMDSDLHSVVNIRLALPGFNFKKKHRKILRQNDSHFRVEIDYARIDKQREQLYVLQKSRFKGFIHDSLEEVLYHGMISSLFDTREIAVYDGDELVAVSYFDIGENSVASLLCLYHPGYKKSSLGIYTMLHEIQWSVDNCKRWYYPGYVLDRPSSFDYKLSVGSMQWFNENKRWSSWNSYSADKTKAHTLRTKLELLKDHFREQDIPFVQRLYPYFAIGHIKLIAEPLLKHPVFVDYEDPGTGEWLIATYDIHEQKYLSLEVEPSSMMKNLIALQPSRDYMNEDQYQMTLLKVVRQGDFVMHNQELYAMS
jgi:arginine-tRNA-protein transferase